MCSYQFQELFLCSSLIDNALSFMIFKWLLFVLTCSPELLRFGGLYLQ